MLGCYSTFHLHISYKTTKVRLKLISAPSSTTLSPWCTEMPLSFTSPPPLRLTGSTSFSRTRQARTRFYCAARSKRPPIRPKQSLSQTFLTCQSTISKIVNVVHETSPSSLVEIGPGLGALTIPLYDLYPSMRAIEIDTRAIDQLRASIPVNIIHDDVLKVQWDTFGSGLTVIGNLPYHITSQILFSLFETNAVDSAVLMMQKEVAQRVVSGTKSKNYGILSVVSQLYSKPEILFTIPPNAFYPVPKVESAIVKFDMTPMEGFDVGDIPLGRRIRKVLKAAFGQRRKVLRNSLRDVVDVPEAIQGCRAEEINPMGFVELASLVGEIDGEGGIWR